MYRMVNIRLRIECTTVNFHKVFNFLLPIVESYKCHAYIRKRNDY